MDSIEQKKSNVLRHVNAIPPAELIILMDQLSLSLDELVLAGLGFNTKKELEKLIIDKKEREAEEEKQRLENEAVQREKQNHFYNIANRNPAYDESRILGLLNEGRLTVEDLVMELNFTNDEIERILNPVEMDTGFTDWKNLPPLPIGRTDVYVFGIVGSGKSAMLAGLLHQAHRQGIIDADSDYRVGVQYKDELIRRIKLGILPRSTRADVLNYIPITLFDENKQGHPFSIIEMSGEKFSQTYRSGRVTDEDSIGAREYLSNSNRKILLFVIDYNHHRIGAGVNEFASQDAQLENVLSLLSRDGTLDKTDAVMLVVSKADLIPNHGLINDSVERFLNNDYLNFINRCKDMKMKHKFKLLLYPFSLGTFKLPRTYRFDPTFSDQLLHDLIALSYVEKKGFITRIFK